MSVFTRNEKIPFFAGFSAFSAFSAFAGAVFPASFTDVHPAISRKQASAAAESMEWIDMRFLLCSPKSCRFFGHGPRVPPAAGFGRIPGGAPLFQERGMVNVSMASNTICLIV